MIYTESKIGFGFDITELTNKIVIVQPDLSINEFTLDVANYSMQGLVDHLNSKSVDNGLPELFEYFGDDLIINDSGYSIDSTSQFNTDKVKFYYPPFLLQSFVHEEDNEELRSSKLNISASGKQELIYFGSDRYIEFEIKYEGNGFDCLGGTPQGLELLRELMKYLIRGGVVSFYPDYTGASSGDYVWDSSQKFRLKEMYKKGLQGLYEIKIKLRRYKNDC